jgi:hypothetical protein
MSFLSMMTAGQGTPAAAGYGAGSSLPPVVADWPPVWREAFEERAAIMEFDGGLSRVEAERRAEACIRSEFERIDALLRGIGDESSAG